MEAFFITHSWFTALVAFLISFFSVWWIHPQLVRLALAKVIVDNPGARKLQRTPVPVLGGVAVFFGISLALGCVSSFCDTDSLMVVFTLMTLMLYIGTIDDIMNLSFLLRFGVEIFGVLLFIYVAGCSINDFHGLWNMGVIPGWIAVPLTVFISVGIINSINLIDGVNGLSSGFCIMACAVFGFFFYLCHNELMMILAAICCGSLIPFFMHNVFGYSSRMFIGDGGTLLMGSVMSIFVIRILDVHSSSAAFAAAGMGLVPFTMAVLSIPVFDTVRVMSMRIYRGGSPFRPDKTHLHHLFIDLGFSHAGATFCILSLNALVILLWWLLYRAGASIDVQLYAVVLLGLLFTFGLYISVEKLDRKGKFFRMLRCWGVLSQIERKGFSLRLQKWLDKI